MERVRLTGREPNDPALVQLFDDLVLRAHLMHGYLTGGS